VPDEPQSDLASQKYRSTVSSISNESFEDSKTEPIVSARVQGTKPTVGMPQINQEDFLPNFTKNQKDTAQPPAPPKKGGGSKAEAKKAAANQASAADPKPPPTYVKKGQVEPGDYAPPYHPSSDAYTRHLDVSSSAPLTTSAGLNPSSQAFRKSSQLQ
jgi:hypothetical protein